MSDPPTFNIRHFLQANGHPVDREGLRLFFFTLGKEAVALAAQEERPEELLQVVREGLAAGEAALRGTVA